MSFKQDIQCTDGLELAFRSGLQALREQDKAHLSAVKPRSLAGSADLDSALVPQFPDKPRWDYVVARKSGNPGKEHLYWIEVHPASSTGNVQEVESKLNWLKDWLAGKALNAYPRDFIWLASGKCVYNQSSPLVKALAAKGVQFKGGHFVIPG